MSLIPDHGPTTRDQGVVFTFTSPSSSPQTCINTSWASPSAPHHLERQVHRAPRRLELSYTGLPFAQVGLVIATPLTAPQWELNPYSCPRFSSGCTCKKPSSSPLHELTWLVPPLPFPHLCSYGDLRLLPFVTSCTSFLQTLAFSHQSLQDKNCVLVVLVVSPGTQ